MILIVVNSEMVEITRRFKSDTAANKFCRQMLKLHVMQRLSVAGPKPKRKDFRKWELRKFKRALADWEDKVKCSAVPIKVNITHI